MKFDLYINTCVSVCVHTTWHHYISQAHGGLNVLLERWLDELVVLLDDTLDVSSPFANVPPQPAHQANVGVCVHKNLHVQQLTREY